MRKYYQILVLWGMVTMLFSCVKEWESDQTPTQGKLKVNVSFVTKPDPGTEFFLQLYYLEEEGDTFHTGEPDVLFKRMLDTADIEEGFTLVVEEMEQSEFTYVIAFADVDRDGEMSDGDIATCYQEYSIQEVMGGCAKPDNIAQLDALTLQMKDIYSSEITIRDLAPFPFGAWIQKSRYDRNDGYTYRADLEFNSITAGTIKMGTIRPTQNNFDFTQTDWWVQYAQATGKRIHGHTIIWGSVPDWVRDFQGDSLAWENLMKDHIQTIVSRYKGLIRAWDVVNEAIDDRGRVKNNIWQEKLGDGYVERAFQYAHEADPDALLFYNDYGHEYSVTRLNAIVNMLNDFTSRGIPVHGIGLQMHTGIVFEGRPTYRWEEAILAAASTGLKVHISELDIAVNRTADPNAVFTPEWAESQKQAYKTIVATYCALPKSLHYGITTWGVGDYDSWLKPVRGGREWPLLFDDNYEQKPAYEGVIEALRSYRNCQE